MESRTMDRDEARAALARWKEVDDVIATELAALTPESKLRQLESLMQSAALFSWPASAPEDLRVLDVWLRLHALERC
jgi:hypothetical protein